MDIDDHEGCNKTQDLQGPYHRCNILSNGYQKISDSITDLEWLGLIEKPRDFARGSAFVSVVGLLGNPCRPCCHGPYPGQLWVQEIELNPIENLRSNAFGARKWRSRPVVRQWKRAAGKRRTALPVTGPHKYRFSGFTLDPESGLMRDDGTEIQLRAKSLELLVFLVSRAGRVVTKDELLDVVWGGMAVSEDSLSQCIHDARRALSDVAQNLIRTVPRRGYLFAGNAVFGGELLRPPAIDLGVPSAAQRDGPSLGVLPLLKLSGDPSQDYFADGMVEEIITALTRMKWLFVIARNSSFFYKGRTVDIKTVSKDLGVRYVLEGSIRTSGDRMRVSAHLVDADTGIHLWAEKFDGLLEDIFDFQDQITARVVGAIAPKLELAEIGRVSRKATESLQAYDYYLRGVADFYTITRSGNDLALANLRRAIELDPNYATAYGFAART